MATTETVTNKILEEARWLLLEGFFAYVATSNDNRIPHVTPVVFVYDRGCIVFITSKIAKKLKDIRKNKRVAVLIDIRDPHDFHNNRAVLLEGTAKPLGILDAVFHLPWLLKMRRVMNWKYPKYMHYYGLEKSNLPPAWRTTLFFSRILVRVTINEAIYMRGYRRIPLSVHSL